MKRNGLRKIVKSVRGRKGSVRRSYWIKASADQKLERGLGILGSGLGSRLGQKIGTRIGPLTAVIGKWTARKEVAGWFWVPLSEVRPVPSQVLRLVIVLELRIS